MFVKTLSINNYKNYNEINLTLSPKINCFVGQNGVGKTNLLDSIYYLSMCKSFLNPIDNQNIKHGEEFAMLQGNFLRNEKEEKIYCSIHKQKKKKVKRNKKDYRKLSEHIGFLPVVMISPIDANLISGGSEEKRKYMDRVISQYDKDYLNTLINYNRALNQRNQLLKVFAEKNTFDPESLELWDEKLIELGNEIHKKRVKFTNELVPIFQYYYDIISGQSEKVGLEYKSQLHDTDFRKLLTDALQKDKAMQYSTAGTHKDDLEFTIEDFPLKKNGSQGQQKTYLVALKFAQYDFIKKVKGFQPILLLDDIFDKFDRQRVEKILKNLAKDHFGQIFITDTSEDRLKALLDDTEADYKLFLIEKNGKIDLK
jgi:DNA replication and repair protein RecF